MSQGKTIIVVLVTLLVGFAGGFVLRPVIVPAQQTAPVAIPSPIAAAPSEARGTQYFVAHIDEARQVVAGCQDGSVRGVSTSVTLATWRAACTRNGGEVLGADW